jgi:predicted SPOUT superfamily RNA methylase MTH1
LVRKSEIEQYWGYDVHIINSLKELLRKGLFDMTLGTSKNGAELVVTNDLLKQFKDSEKILIAFGSPKKGLTEILGENNVNNFFDFYLNMIPGQGTETVRTSEAFVACLAILNLLS